MKRVERHWRGGVVMLAATRILLLLLFSMTVECAHSEDAKPSDSISIGPFPITRNVQGVDITANASSDFWVITKADALYLKANINVDLFDLQQKFGAIVDTFPLPKDNCASYTLLNPVVSVPTKALVADNDAAVVSMSGRVDGWTCVQNPIPQTYWDSNGCKGHWPWGGEYSFGCVRTRPGSPIKNQTVQQPFDASIPIYLKKSGDSGVQIVLGDPSLKLGGQFASITNKALEIAGVNLNDRARAAIQAAIDPAQLIFLVPKEYQDLNPAVEDAGFFSDTGKLTARVRLSAKVPADRINEFLKQLVGGLKPQAQ